jgi:hypothetical protein
MRALDALPHDRCLRRDIDNGLLFVAKPHLHPECRLLERDWDNPSNLPNGQPESYWSSVELVSRNALVLNGLGTFRVIGKP